MERKTEFEFAFSSFCHIYRVRKTTPPNGYMRSSHVIFVSLLSNADESPRERKVGKVGKKKSKKKRGLGGGGRGAASLCDTELLAIILGAPLCDWHERWLVRKRTAEGANAVIALGKAASDVGGEVSLAVAIVVDAFEEDEYRS